MSSRAMLTMSARCQSLFLLFLLTESSLRSTRLESLAFTLGPLCQTNVGSESAAAKKDIRKAPKRARNYWVSPPIFPSPVRNKACG